MTEPIKEVSKQEMTEDTMALWNAVCSTDPKYTKKVGTRGGFTAIDAYYRIKTATELWGPMGLDWHVTPTFEYYENLVVCKLEISYPASIEHRGLINSIAACNIISTAKDGSIRTDSDAYKKAFTDAITKGLSYLGFSADVFLGNFDDNKYVDEQNAKYGNNKAASKPTAPPDKDDFFI